MLLLTLTRIFVLLVPVCCFVSDLKRFKRQVSDEDQNAVIEVFNNCKCVYYYQCNDNNVIITDGESIINIRRNNGVPRISCKGAFENEKVCCKLPGNTTSLGPELKSTYEVTEIVDENRTENNTTVDPDLDLPKKTNCGAQKTILSVRIFAGEDELTPMSGEFPWIAAIFKKKASGNYKFHCSGSLIHPKVILTANHCVHKKNASLFKVILNGEITLAPTGKNLTQERSVSEIVPHPDYYSGGLYNDVALLILDEEYIATKQNFINTLCLPPSSVSLDNTRCLVAGWGKDAQGEKSQFILCSTSYRSTVFQTGNTLRSILTKTKPINREQNLKNCIYNIPCECDKCYVGKQIMKKVELPFVEFNQCQDLLRQTRLGPEFNLHKSFMCAGGEKGKDACKGDGGSPLMCPFPSENRYFQIGIVSWGIGCGEENVPGVYANVNVFTEWIKTELSNRQLTF